MKFCYYTLCFLLIFGSATACADNRSEKTVFSEDSIQKMVSDSNALFGAYFSGDPNEVYRLTRSLARNDYPLSQCFLAGMYKGENEVKTDKKKAMECYRKAAEGGDVLGQSILADVYNNAFPGNPKEAIRWYKLAAEQGDAQAQLQIASMYEGGFGVEIDWEEAAKWYEMAADQGLSNAQFPLCQFYYQGKGVEKDYVKSYFWCNLAVNSPYFFRKAEAGMYLDSLLPAVMSPSEVEKALKMADDWREKHSDKNITDNILIPIAQTVHKGFLNFLK